MTNNAHRQQTTSTSLLSRLFSGHCLFFIIVTLFSFIIRLYRLDLYPPSLNWDEVSHGYNAYSLLKTGKDQWGTPWPLFNFRAYGDYPTVLNLYLTIPFIKLFGLNAISIRLPSAILGSLTVVLSYFLCQAMFSDRRRSLFLMLLVCLSPWTFFPSRAVFQSTIAQFFLVSGITCLLYSRSKTSLLPLSSLLFGLSLYAYHNTRLVSPIIYFSFLLILYRQANLTLKKILPSVAIFLIFFIPSLINLFHPTSRARSNWVSLLNPSAINYINHQRNNFSGSPLVAKIIYNKITYLSFNITKNYLSFLDPKNLFFVGTANQQFNIPNTGILLSLWLPFFYIGLVYAFIQAVKKNPPYLLLVCWFIVGLLPAVITAGDWPIIRAYSIIPVPHLFTLIGLFLTILSLKNHLFSLLFLVFSLIQFLFYLHNYFFKYFNQYSFSWQYGYQQAVEYLKQHSPEYRQIFFTKKYGEPHEFLFFYWPVDPRLVQDQNLLKSDYHDHWYWVNSFGSFTFLNDWEIVQKTQNPPPSTLLVTSPNNYDSRFFLLQKTIYFLNNQPAFDIVSSIDLDEK